VSTTPWKFTAFVWLERALLVAGLTLGAWSLAAVLQARFYATLPVPEPVAMLPGDAGTSRPARTSPNRGSWVARLEAPTIGLAATVLEGSDEAMLARAAGRIEDTAMPGDAGNVGIAGHRDTTFRPVRELTAGDPLRLTTTDRILEYRVTSTTIVNPEDVWVLDPTDVPTLTLVTCYPFTYIGHAPQRFIVKAELISEVARGPGTGRPGPAGTAEPGKAAKAGG